MSNQVPRLFIQIFMACLCFNNSACANVHQDMTQFFNSFSEQTHGTPPQHYQAQSAGYYSGGSLVGRNTIQRTQLASVTLPSLRAGCGGIDLFTGGFSYINADQFVQTMKNIMNNAKGYAFQLALDTVTPMISGNLKYFQDIATKINNANINSCESAVGLVGGLMPRTQAMQRQVCATLGTQSGLFDDWAAARQGCGAGGRSSKVWQHARGDKRYQGTLLDSGNLAWQALQNAGLAQADPELAELFMSISGTLVVSNTHPNATQAQYYPSLVTSDNLLKVLLEGGSLSIWRCRSRDHCVNLHKRPLTLTAQSAFLPHVRRLLKKIVEQISEDKPLGPASLALLNHTQLPVYKILMVQLAFYKTHALADLDSLAEIVAVDMLNQYLSGVLQFMTTQTRLLNFPTALMKSFDQQVTKTQTLLSNLETKHAHRLQQYFQIVTQTKQMESYLANQLTERLNSLEKS